MKELGLNRVNSLVHPGNKAFDSLRMVDRGLSVAKKSHDSVNVSSSSERKSIVARARLRAENMPRDDSKHSSLDSRELFGGQSGLDSGRRRAERDVRAKAGLDEPGSPEAQEWLFKSIFEEELLDRGIYVSGNQERELLAINFNSRVSDVPEEWCKSFLIAKGKAYERVRMDGYNLHNSSFNTKNRIIMLSYNNELYEFYRDELPAKLPRIFKEKSKEGKIVWHVKDLDSSFTCIEACKEIEKLEGDKNLYNLQGVRYKQEISKLIKLQRLKEALEINYPKVLRSLDKTQISEFADALENDLSQQYNIEYIRNLIVKHNHVEDTTKNAWKRIIMDCNFLINKKEKELKQSKNREEAYYMIMGMPEVRSIVEKLPKDYTIDSMTVEEKRADGLSLPTYKVGLFIKRANSADKKNGAEK